MWVAATSPLSFGFKACGDVASDPFDRDEASAVIEDRHSPVLGPDDPPVWMNPTQLNGELQLRQVVLERLEDDVAVVRMHAREREVGIRVKVRRGSSDDRGARGVDVVVAARRLHAEPVDHVWRVLEQTLEL